MDPTQTKSLWQSLMATLKSGGYYDTVMAMGSEMDRVKTFLQTLESDPKPKDPEALDVADPSPMPLFPGLHNVPFPDPADYPWVPKLEAAFDELRAEGLAQQARFQESSYGAMTQQGGRWLQGYVSGYGSRLPSFYFGGMEPLKAIEVCSSLPRFAGFSGNPFADTMYSLMSPGMQIATHISSDNLRVRCHLPLKIPGNCAIEVAGEAREWQEGKVLLLEDSFWHTAWNRSEDTRMVLMLDLWHPDLTDLEIEALSAFYKKSEIRCKLVLTQNAPKELVEGSLRPFFQQEDATDPNIAKYWPKQPVA